MRDGRFCLAFTLVELLVTLAIMGGLAAAILSASGYVRGSADRSKAISNMRAIGSGIGLYAADHDELLPGPLWPGQMPQLDPNRDGRLVRELAPYLGIETPSQPVVIDLFVPPAYRRVMGNDALSTARTYVVNMDVDDAGSSINPWGTLVGNTGSTPLRLSSVPHNAWAFSDADQGHPRVSAASWASNTPEKPIHGKRLAWFFNGSVEGVNEEDLQ